jgi:phosphatidylglycerophosphate synthase
MQNASPHREFVVMSMVDARLDDSSTKQLRWCSCYHAHQAVNATSRGKIMTISTLLIIVLILLLIGAIPAWPYSRSWGYRPVGGLGLIIVIVLVLLLLGVI